MATDACKIVTYRCSNCRQNLPRDAFGYRGVNDRKGIREGADYVCKACRSQYHQKLMQDPEKRERARQSKLRSRARHPDRGWDQYLRKTFGISAEDYYRMLNEQGGVCAICGGSEPRGRSKTRFAVDHCHKTGKVRGLLCGPCNTGIGHLRDDVANLRAAIKYLERAQNDD